MEKKRLNFLSDSLPFFIIAGMLAAIVFVVVMVGAAFGAEQKKAYIGEREGVTVNRFLVLHDGADDSLNSGVTYSEEEIEKMLLFLEAYGGNKVALSEAAHDVYLFNKETGADVAGLLALLYYENGMSSRAGVEYYNFYSIPCPKGKTAYRDAFFRDFWDLKADCPTIGKALVEGMDCIRKNYFLKGQDSFYKMAFNNYGFPKTKEEADKAEITHSYLPYWDDTPYLLTGYNSDFSIVNRLAEYRKDLRRIGGVE